VVLGLFGPLQSATCSAELFFKSLGSFERNSKYSNLRRKGRDLASARVNLEYRAIPQYRRASLSCSINSHCSAAVHNIYISAEEEFSGLWGRVDPVGHPVSSSALTQIPSYSNKSPLWASSSHLGIKPLPCCKQACKSHRVLHGQTKRQGG